MSLVLLVLAAWVVLSLPLAVAAGWFIAAGNPTPLGAEAGLPVLTPRLTPSRAERARAEPAGRKIA